MRLAKQDIYFFCVGDRIYFVFASRMLKRLQFTWLTALTGPLLPRILDIFFKSEGKRDISHP